MSDVKPLSQKVDNAIIEEKGGIFVLPFDPSNDIKALEAERDNFKNRMVDALMAYKTEKERAELAESHLREAKKWLGYEFQRLYDFYDTEEEAERGQEYYYLKLLEKALGGSESCTKADAEGETPK